MKWRLASVRWNRAARGWIAVDECLSTVIQPDRPCCARSVDSVMPTIELPITSTGVCTTGRPAVSAMIATCPATPNTSATLWSEKVCDTAQRHKETIQK